MVKNSWFCESSRFGSMWYGLSLCSSKSDASTYVAFEHGLSSTATSWELYIGASFSSSLSSAGSLLISSKHFWSFSLVNYSPLTSLLLAARMLLSKSAVSTRHELLLFGISPALTFWSSSLSWFNSTFKSEFSAYCSFNYCYKSRHSSDIFDNDAYNSLHVRHSALLWSSFTCSWTSTYIPIVFYSTICSTLKS